MDSYAAYAQANFHFTDQLFATVGGRFSKDKKEGSTTSRPIPCWQTSVRLKRSTLPDIDDSKFTYRLGLNYEPNEDILLSSAATRPATSRPATTRAPVLHR